MSGGTGEPPVSAAGRSSATWIVVVVCAAILLESLQFSILSPVLPLLADEFNLDDVGAGVISSAYAVGLVVFAIPAGRLASRIDERVGVAVSLALIAIACAWFALADSAWQLTASRFLSGAASALVWAGGLAWVSSTGPRESQATRLAAVISSAIVGGLIGPSLGTLITLTGRAPVFLGIAIAACFLVVPVWLLGATRSVIETTDRGLRKLVRAAWLPFCVILFIGLYFSSLGVMIPLEAVSLGASATVVGTAFVVGSLGQALLGPLVGRLTDRRGPAKVMAAALAATAALTVGLVVAPGALGPVVVLAVLFPIGGMVYTPTTVAVDAEAHRMALAPAIAFSAWNLAWALGVAVGAVAGPALATVTGNAAVYVLLGAAAAGLAVGAVLSLPRGRAEGASGRE